MNDLVFRRMARRELDLLVDWAATEGWNPGLHDAIPFWAADPGGFVAAEVRGELVGGGLVVSYDGRFGFMGFFIVLPHHRGQGMGAKLWRARRDLLLDRLSPGASIGMDGVEAMVPFYQRGGFRLAQRDRRFQFIGRNGAAHAGLVPARELPFADLSAFDADHFPAPRPAFLAAWLSQPGVVSLAAVEGSRITGYGVLRRCRAGRKVGPLFATSAEVAERLLAGLAAAAPGENLYVDVPERNLAALAMAHRWEMREVFGCARMYLGDPPSLPDAEIFGVTTFELG